MLLTGFDEACCHVGKAHMVRVEDNLYATASKEWITPTITQVSLEKNLSLAHIGGHLDDSLIRGPAAEGYHSRGAFPHPDS